MAYFNKEDTTFGVTVDNDVMVVDMADVADLVYGDGVANFFHIDRNNMVVNKNSNGTYHISFACKSFRTMDQYGSFDANEELDLFRKCDVDLIVLEDGTVVSATLTNVLGNDIAGYDTSTKMREFPDMSYGLKPSVVEKLYKNPQRAMLINFNKLKDEKTMGLLLKVIDDAFNHSEIQYKKVREMKEKIHERAKKVFGKNLDGAGIEA